jgi:hypothetical protein
MFGVSELVCHLQKAVRYSIQQGYSDPNAECFKNFDLPSELTMRSRLGFRLHDWAASNFSAPQYPRSRAVFIERTSGFDRFFAIWMRSLKVIALTIVGAVLCAALFCIVAMFAAAL